MAFMNSAIGPTGRASTSLSMSLPLGSLSLLPVELMHSICDELLMGSTRLTHKGLCGLRSFALTNQSAASLVNSYFMRRIPPVYLQDQLNVLWWPYMDPVVPLEWDEIVEIAPIEGRPEVGRDIITDTIMDDCPDCFDWLCTRIPGLNGGCCNEHGWSFPAIAAYAGSFQMLEYFCTSRSIYKDSIVLLACPANANSLRPTPLGIMAQRQDLQFFEKLLDMGIPSVIRGALTREEKLRICEFATPALAEQLEQAGVKISDITTSSSSSWHAGVVNGPAFLDYLKRTSTISKNGPRFVKITPLYAAVKANRLDSVRWFKQHGANRRLTNHSDSRENPVQLATTLGSEMSVAILEELLPAPGRGKISSFDSGKLLESLVEGLNYTACSQAVRSDLDEKAYLNVKDHYEDRAIRKCRLILRVSSGDHLLPVSDAARPRLYENGRHRAIQKHANAKKMAYLAGFQLLFHTMDSARVYICSLSSTSVVFEIR